MFWSSGFLLLTLGVGLISSGCGTTAIYSKYDPGDKYANRKGWVPVSKVHLNKGGKCKASPDGAIEFDTRERSIYDKFMAPIITGAKESSTAALPL